MANKRMGPLLSRLWHAAGGKDNNKKTNRVALNAQAMKLASQLYHRMLNEPDFKDDDKQQLWKLALSTAKAKIGMTK